MKDLKLQELKIQPDMSQVKPPTTPAIKSMIKNLRSVAKNMPKSV